MLWQLLGDDDWMWTVAESEVKCHFEVSRFVATIYEGASIVIYIIWYSVLYWHEIETVYNFASV